MGKIILIVAKSKNNVIGKNNDLPWGKKQKSDMSNFVAVTLGHILICGRKTFESFGSKPLPNREMIVISRQQSRKDPSGAYFVESLKDAIEKAKKLDIDNNKKFFIIGGGQIYNQAFTDDIVDEVYMTEIETEVNGDTLFPNLFMSDFCPKEESRIYWNTDEKNTYPSNFVIYKRKNA
jgi:dihydrofolate reductase